jgi:21S rRNA (uridine2791-2'-O)-methyltransferase
LGYAPGSWSQVAKNRVGERGRVVGIDVIPAQPPRGVSALQGDFLSEGVQGLVREFVREWKSEEAEEEVRDGEEESGEVKSVVERARGNAAVAVGGGEEEGTKAPATTIEEEGDVTETLSQTLPPTLIAVEKEKKPTKKAKKLSPAALDLQHGRVVDVVLSDMCAPFPGLELSSWVNSVNRPYRRMMNTSGNPFRDHAGSIVRFSRSLASQAEGSDNPVLT